MNQFPFASVEFIEIRAMRNVTCATADRVASTSTSASTDRSRRVGGREEPERLRGAGRVADPPRDPHPVVAGLDVVREYRKAHVLRGVVLRVPTRARASVPSGTAKTA